MDNFQMFLKKQLLQYVEAERKKGISLEQIEISLLNAGHHKNIVDEVFLELRKEQAGQKVSVNEPVTKDFLGMLKRGFAEFMAQASEKDIKDAKKDIKEGRTESIVKEVIKEAEVIEEKLMFEIIAFFIYLGVIAFLVLLSAGGTDSDIAKVAIGFAPAILSVFISFLALKLADIVPIYVFIPMAISTGFYALGKFTDFGIFKSFDIEGLAIVNFLIGFLFSVIVVYIKFVKPNSMKKRVIRRTPHLEIKTNSPEVHTQSPVANKKRNEIEELRKEFRL